MDAVAKRVSSVSAQNRDEHVRTEGFGELAAAFAENFTDVRRYAYRRAGADAADEVASETFVRAVQGWASFNPSVGPVRLWLFGIAANVAREHDRAARRRRLTLLRLRQGLVSGPKRGFEQSIADVEAVDAALKDLRQELKDVLLLVDGLEFTYEEAATALRIPVGTVRSRLSTGRRRLEKVLDRVREAK